MLLLDLPRHLHPPGDIRGKAPVLHSNIQDLGKDAIAADGTYFVIFGTPVDGQQVGLSLLSDNGGIFPNGLLPMIILMQGVLFAYASIELVGTAAGETENPEKIMPKAINSVVFRIAVFYVGSVILLALLLPYTSYEKGVSPFV
ncbi:hypothetical protein AB0O49_18195, partial [Pseudarthrobacter oxydans]